MSDVTPSVTVNLGDGFSVTSNEGDEASIKANFEAEEKEPDDPESDPEKEAKEKTSKAASELGKLGGKAAAEAKAKETKEKGQKAVDDLEKAAEAKMAKEAKVEAKPGNGEDDEAEAQETRRNARIERLARERSEARAEAADAKRRLAEREAADAVARAPQGDGKPQRAQYQSDEDYAEALADHRLTAKVREFAEIQRMEAEAKTRAERVAAFKKQVDDELVKSLDPRIGHAEPAFIVKDKPGASIGPENVVAEEFVRSSMAKEVGIHLSKHPEELDEMLSAPDYREIVRQFAKLEERLSRKPEKAPEPAKETESKAPRPPRSIPAGGGDVEEDVDSDDVPFERFAAVHNARLRRQRNGR